MGRKKKRSEKIKTGEDETKRKRGGKIKRRKRKKMEKIKNRRKRSQKIKRRRMGVRGRGTRSTNEKRKDG